MAYQKKYASKTIQINHIGKLNVSQKIIDLA